MRSELADQRLQPVRNLATNPSFETAGPVTTVRENLFDPSGVVELALTTSTIIGGSSYRGFTVAVTPGEVYSFRRLVPLSGRFAVVFSTVAPANGVEHFGGTGLNTSYYDDDVLDGIVVPTTAAFMFIYLSNTSETVTQVLIEKSYTVGPYFDGSTAAAGDFIYSWSGTVDASTSLQQGVGVAGSIVAPSALSFQSSEWVSSGAKSVRVVPTSTNADSYWDMGSPASVLKAGKTYTIIAKARLSTPLTGPLMSRSRAIYISDGGGTTGPPFPNEVGVHEVRWTKTMTNNAAALRLYNGATAGNGDVWWDDLMVVEGVYVGDYGDGNTPGWRWDGASEASTSTGYPTLSRP